MSADRARELMIGHLSAERASECDYGWVPYPTLARRSGRTGTRCLMSRILSASATRSKVSLMDWLTWVAVAVALSAVAVAGVLAVRVRRSRMRVAQLQEQLARDTETERALAAAAERGRIAREMHDVVAHTLSVVVAQADGGRFAATQSPQAAAQALETIAEVGRSALAEMRALLGLLRDSHDDAALGPQPSIDDIPDARSIHA